MIGRTSPLPKKTLWSPKKSAEFSIPMNQALKQIREFMSKTAKAQIFLKEGKFAMDNGDYQGAIECFNAGITYNAATIHFYSFRGNCRRCLGQYKDAYFDYSLAIRLEPENASYYCYRGICLNKLHKFSLALEDMDVACKLDPVAQNFISRATVLHDSGRHDDCIKDLTIALQFEGMLTEVRAKCLFRRAGAYIDVYRYSDAIEDLSLMLRLDPVNVQARLLIGRAYKFKNDLHIAEEHLTNAIVQDPNQPSFYSERGDIRFRSGMANMIVEAIYDFDQAVSMYEKRILQMLESSPGRFFPEISRRKEGNGVENRRFSQKLATKRFYDDVTGLQEIDILLADALTKRAQAKLMAEGSFSLLDDALSDATRALAIVPDSDHISLVVSTCLIRKKKYTEAMELLQKILQHSPDNDRALYQFSFCQRSAGRRKDAIEGLTKIISSTENGLGDGLAIPVQKVYEIRGTIFHEIQAHKLALVDFGRAIGMNPERPENFYFRADCHAKLGNFEQAIEDYNLAEAKKFPNLCALNIQRGTVHRLLGSSDAACKDFEKALMMLNGIKTNLRSKIIRVRIVCLQAMSFIDMERYDDAIGALHEIFVYNRDLLEGIALYANQKKDYDSCQQDNLDIETDDQSTEVTLRKLDWMINYHLALANYRIADYMGSAEMLRNCVTAANGVDSSKYSPDEYTLGLTQYFLGMSLLRQRKVMYLDEANSYFHLALESAWSSANANKVLVNFSIGKVKQLQDSHHDAIKYFTEALLIDPENPYVLFRRAWSQKAVGECVLAGDDFESAKSMRPGDPNFTVDYRSIYHIQFMEMDTDPDLTRQFPVLLPVPGQIH